MTLPVFAHNVHPCRTVIYWLKQALTSRTRCLQATAYYIGYSALAPTLERVFQSLHSCGIITIEEKDLPGLNDRLNSVPNDTSKPFSSIPL